MDPVLLTVLAIWAALAVVAAVFVAALGRSGLREEQARDRVRAEHRSPRRPEPFLASGTSVRGR